jgi:Lar family restriction alleviation protein
MSEELKPCPFCGYGKILQNSGDGYFVSCMKCGSRGSKKKYYETMSDAITAWNTRPIEDEKDKQIAELKAELSRNADEGYVGFMLGIEQMKKKLAEKDKEIARLKEVIADIGTITCTGPVNLDVIFQKCKEAIGEPALTEAYLKEIRKQAEKKVKNDSV